MIVISSKGQLDTIFVLVSLLIIAITAVIAVLIFSNFHTQFVTKEGLSSPTARTNFDLVYNRSSSIIDSIFLVFLIGSWIAVFITSALLDVHPAFFILGLIFNIIILFAVPFLANMFLDFSGSSGLSSATASLPIISYVFNHLLAIAIVWVFSIMIALYAKFQGNNQLGGGYA